MSGQQSPFSWQSASHWQAAAGSKTPQRPTQELSARHWPADVQTSPGGQSPHEPKQPSLPQTRPVQSGSQVQTLAVSHTPTLQMSGQQSPKLKQLPSHWHGAASS
jgi:hypothetical protein